MENQRKEKKQLIAKLLQNMFEPEWFSNEHTHGCYTHPDFLDDLRNFDVDELKALRRYQQEKLDAYLFYEHVWNGKYITYRSFK